MVGSMGGAKGGAHQFLTERNVKERSGIGGDETAQWEGGALICGNERVFSKGSFFLSGISALPERYAVLKHPISTLS